MSKRAKIIVFGIGALALPNFLTFWLIAVYQGGDALNGYVQNGHYFLCAHGACKEVSKPFWTFSYWHAISAMTGIALIFVALAILVNTKDIEVNFNESSR